MDDRGKEKENINTNKSLDLITYQVPEGQFRKSVIKEGKRFVRPLIESVCVLNISFGKLDQEEQNEKMSSLIKQLDIPVGNGVELTIGMAESGVIKLIENCIMTMQEGECSEFIVDFKTIHPQEPPTTRETVSVTLTITLCNFSEVKPSWEYTSEEKYKLALFHKEKGSSLFKDGKTEAAFFQYSTAIKYLISISECSTVEVVTKEKDEDEISCVKKYNALMCICYLNLAACQAKVNNHKSIITNCSHALELDAANVKGLYRRAQAYKASGQLQSAKLDLKKALEIEPQNRAVVSLLRSCQS